MADITMCANRACPDRGDCYRAQATPHPTWQAYFSPSPKDGVRCTYYWPLSDHINRNPKEANAQQTETK